MHDDGFALMPQLISRQRAKQVCTWIDELKFLAGDERDDSDSDDATTFHQNLFNRHPQWLDLIDPPQLIEAVEELIGEWCHIVGMTAWRTEPGHGKETLHGDGTRRLHADQIFFPLDEELLINGRVQLPIMLMTLHYYLVDIDQRLAPTWVIPGSHKAGAGPAGSRPKPGYPGTLSGAAKEWRGRAPQPVLCGAGDGMLFRSELWHSGSRNDSPDRARYLLQVHYSPRGTSQRFPPHLEFRLNEEVVAAANVRQRRLLGGHKVTAYG